MIFPNTEIISIFCFSVIFLNKIECFSCFSGFDSEVVTEDKTTGKLRF